MKQKPRSLYGVGSGRTGVTSCAPGSVPIELRATLPKSGKGGTDLVMMWQADVNSALQIRERAAAGGGAPASRDEEQLLCVKQSWPGHRLARRHPPRWLRALWPR
jgi:hypothetical protein